MASYIECTNKQRRLPPLTIQEYIYTYQDREALDMYPPVADLHFNNDHQHHLRSSYYNNHNDYHQFKSQKLSMDIDLMTHIFRGSLDSNLLRRVLWPVIFNLVEHRDRIVSFNNDFKVIPHECNVERWQQLSDGFNVYLQQWRSISFEQESRFALFRERKSSIERDVIRCDRLHPFYKDRPENLEALTTLLMTYMMYDFDIGYVQGMLDLAAPILFVFEGDLVKAFWTFNEVMKLFRRNFEQSQKTIHFQLNCLFKLIKYTDNEFADYLVKLDSANCFFAFRCIVCQFKREIMKESEDDYSNVLKLWDTIWCVERLSQLKQQQLKQQCCDNNHCGIGIDIPQVMSQQQGNKNNHNNNNNNQVIVDHHSTMINNNNHFHCPGHIQISSTVIEVDGHQHFELSCLNQQHNHHNGSNNHNHSRNRALNSSASVVSDLLTNNSSDWTSDDPMMIKGDFATGCESTIDSSISCKRTESMQSQTSLPDSIPFNGHDGSGYDGGHYDDYLYHHDHHRSGSSNHHGTNTTTNTTTITTTNNINNNNNNNDNNQLITSVDKTLVNTSMVTTTNEHNTDDIKQMKSNCLCTAPTSLGQSKYSSRQSFYSATSFGQTQADLPRFSLSETETFVLSLCLSLIRRERNLIMDSKLDATEILQHFIDPKLCDNLDLFIEHATNIYSYLKEDFDIDRLFEDEKPSPNSNSNNHSQQSQRQHTFISTTNNMNCTFDEGYDFLNDYLIINSIPED